MSRGRSGKGEILCNGCQHTRSSSRTSCGASISAMAAMIICSVSIFALSSVSRPDARDRPSVRSLSSHAVRVAALRANPVSNCVRSEALILSLMSSSGMPLSIADASTANWRCRAPVDSSAQTPSTRGSRSGASPAPTAIPMGPAIAPPRRAPLVAATAR